MRKFTNREKQNGELAVRSLSKKAQEGYCETDPLDVYEYKDENGTFYAVKDADGTTDGMSIKELEQCLEGWCIE